MTGDFDMFKQPCPHCGYCPTCGRGPAQPVYYNPWWGMYPPPNVINTCGGTTALGVNTSKFMVNS